MKAIREEYLLRASSDVASAEVVLADEEVKGALGLAIQDLAG